LDRHYLSPLVPALTDPNQPENKMAARKSVAAIPTFTHTRSTGRYKQRHHQRFQVEIVFMRFQ